MKNFENKTKKILAKEILNGTAGTASYISQYSQYISNMLKSRQIHQRNSKKKTVVDSTPIQKHTFKFRNTLIAHSILAHHFISLFR